MKYVLRLGNKVATVYIRIKLFSCNILVYIVKGGMAVAISFHFYWYGDEAEKRGLAVNEEAGPSLPCVRRE